MGKLDNNKSAPTRRTEINNDPPDSGTKNNEVYSRELEQPGRSNATPDIPQEMPVREIK
jgi:hypothetical protein